MNGMIANQNTSERAISLTKNEAFALLEICMMTECEDNSIRESAMSKIGNLCREFLSEEARECSAARIPVHATLRGTFARVLHHRETQPIPEPAAA